ncbi:MAG TPA: GGDEF domain-containing protein [Anaerolineae bacterium]|jgi:diguanylate cyclase (GGDEF)-like protein|nr:GGDEF domain-containing protein [Anaerolineae bacterium]
MSHTTPIVNDELTGLLSRRAFHDVFDSLLAKSKGSDALIALAFLDIDSFEHINQEYGHSGGDDVLKTIGEMIRQACGEDAICARYGGDEFAVIFPNTEREQAFLALEKLRTEAAANRFTVGKKQDIIEGIALSGGIACYPVDGRLKSELMRKADQALYRAKVTGRAKIRLAYDEKMVPKTSHYTQTQLERLTKLATEREAGEAELLREAVDDLLSKYGINAIER